MSSIARTDRPLPHPSVETAWLEPEVVLFDARHHRVHHLNRAASAVWILIDGESSRDQIADELSEIFGAPTDVIRPDVDDAVAEFDRLGLLAAETYGDGHDHLPDDADAAKEIVSVLPRPPDP